MKTPYQSQLRTKSTNTNRWKSLFYLRAKNVMYYPSSSGHSVLGISKMNLCWTNLVWLEDTSPYSVSCVVLTPYKDRTTFIAYTLAVTITYKRKITSQYIPKYILFFLIYYLYIYTYNLDLSIQYLHLRKWTNTCETNMNNLVSSSSKS